MVWLVQNCRSNKCLQFLKPPELPVGLIPPPGPLPGLCLGPAGDLKQSPDPSPTHAPLTTNPGFAPGIYHFFPVFIKINGKKKRIENPVYIS